MNPCLYKPEQEETLFIRKQAKTWQRSGFVSKNQLRIIEERTPAQLITTSLCFRLLYFFFTLLCLIATVCLIIWLLDVDDEFPLGIIFLVFCIPMYILAEYTIHHYHFYRHGIEEALALMSLSFFCGGIVLIIFPTTWHRSDPGISTFAAFCCAFAYWLYLRFGFLYGALISMAALSLFIFQFFFSPQTDRILCFLCFGLLFLISLQTESDALADFRKKRKGIIQAFLFAGIYLSINLRLFNVAESWIGHTPTDLSPYACFPLEVYWTTYILIYLIPMIGLYLGIKNRKRVLINVAAIALALSLATNKDYLGLRHYTWDSIIFGTMLVLVAVFVIRWLAKGQNKERYGFTAERTLKPEAYGLNLAEIGAAALPGITSSPVETQSTDPSPFEGGQSGGGGASRSF
jgi:hypothetical protein